MIEPARPQRRGFVIVTVLIVGAIALLVATSAIYLASAERAAAVSVPARVQGRAIAWSGVQAVMNRLDIERDAILDGRMPSIDDELVIYDAGGRIALVRLLPHGAGGERLVPEASKLDLNAIDAEALAATGLVDDDLAARIVAHRDGTAGGAIMSIVELLHVRGVTPELLYGDIEEIDTGIEAPASGEPRGLADVLSVYAHEPAIQRSERRRIDLAVEWTDELSQRVAERFDEGVASALGSIFEGGRRFESEASIFETMNEFQVPIERWPDLVDTFTTDSGPYHFGRLDINSASAMALRGLPGITPEIAASIESARSGLTSDERTTIAWPAQRGLVEREAYEKLAGRITTRSWTFRLLLASGEVSADEPEAEIASPLIWEVVVDLSDPTPRVAYLRDVTLWRTAILIALDVPAAEEESPEAALVADTPIADASIADAPLADAPLADAPMAEVPMTNAPLADAALTSAPIPAAPAADAPIANAAPETAAAEPARTARRRTVRWLAAPAHEGRE